MAWRKHVGMAIGDNQKDLHLTDVETSDEVSSYTYTQMEID